MFFIHGDEKGGHLHGNHQQFIEYQSKDDVAGISGWASPARLERSWVTRLTPARRSTISSPVAEQEEKQMAFKRRRQNDPSVMSMRFRDRRSPGAMVRFCKSSVKTLLYFSSGPSRVRVNVSPCVVTVSV